MAAGFSSLATMPTLSPTSARTSTMSCGDSARHTPHGFERHLRGGDQAGLDGRQCRGPRLWLSPAPERGSRPMAGGTSIA